MSSKNCAYWVDNNPHDVFATTLHDVNVIVWCGITCTFILGPYFFEEVTDGDLRTCTVTKACYLDILTHYAIPDLQRQNALSEVVWMQDVTSPHVGPSVKRLLSQQFGDRVFSKSSIRFRGHQDILISHQWIYYCRDM